VQQSQGPASLLVDEMDLAALRAIDGFVDAPILEGLIAPELDQLAGVGAFEKDWRHSVIMPLGQEATLT
jgi:hypothetical protein